LRPISRKKANTFGSTIGLDRSGFLFAMADHKHTAVCAVSRPAHPLQKNSSEHGRAQYTRKGVFCIMLNERLAGGRTTGLDVGIRNRHWTQLAAMRRQGASDDLMTLQELLETLKCFGVKIALGDGDTISIEPPDVLPPAVRSALADHRAALIALIR